MVAFKKHRRKATTENSQHGGDADGSRAGEISLKPAFKTLTLRVLAIIIYMCLGALVFCAIEYKDQDKTLWNRRARIMRLKLKDKYNISDRELRDYEKTVQNMYLEERASHHEWSYYQSLYFVSTVTTTIGYGHLTPQTQAGRLFLIVFAVVGIPLNILALATVGEHITIGICLGISRLSRLCFKKRTVRHINIKVMIISITLMVFMLFVGGSLYVSTEDWTYIDSIYYCFVALATIGFGDLVPNDGKPPNTSFGKALWGLRVLYISVGLSLVSTVFTAISNAIEEINALLGWPKKGDKGEIRRNSQLDGEMPGLKGRTMKLPNHLTYRTAVDEMHDNLASVLPIPGFKPRPTHAGSNQVIFDRMIGRNSSYDIVNNESSADLGQGIDSTSDNESTRKRRPLRKKRSLNGRISSVSMSSKGSTEVAVDIELPNHRTIVEINEEKDYEDACQMNIANGTAIGTTIRLNEITESYVGAIGTTRTLSREAKSINSSENDGYESSHHTHSERSFSYPEQYDKSKSRRLLDIEAQISDFANCSQKNNRQAVYRQGHLPPGYHEHIRSKINDASGFNDYRYTGLKINGTYMARKRKTSIDLGQKAHFTYENAKGKLQ